ncbi:MAG: NAD-dependent epimerase [Xanthobacteraceae bacterium]|jgi:UDP-glucuronate 4-epimerase
MTQNPVLVTGAAGFIGFALARRLLESGRGVVGIDSVNDYYDPALKEARLAVLRQFPQFRFHKLDLADRGAVEILFHDGNFGPVVHLAAQAGVRYSLENPHAYLDANLAGFLNVLEGCRHRRTEHLVFASSSSVYGANTRLPFSVHDNVDHPISLYAATKKANELMAHAYSHLYGLPATGLRFFTVYGPWGRPDMAMFIFAKAIAEGRPIKLFNYGRARRDFTYIDDVIAAVVRLIDKVPAKADGAASGAPDPATSTAPWRIYNIGNNRSIEISHLVALLEGEFGRKAETVLLPMQPGDVAETCADIDDLARDVGFRPATAIEDGVHKFVAWYRDYYRP